MDDSAVAEKFDAAAKQFNSGGPIPQVSAFDMKQMWDATRRMKAEIPPGRKVAFGLGTYAAYGVEAASIHPEQLMPIGLRLEITSALLKRGVLDEYKHGKELDEKVFRAAATLPCDKHDLSEAMLPLRLAQLPAEVVAEAKESMRAEGYDPDKPNVDSKFLDWLRQFN